MDHLAVFAVKTINPKKQIGRTSSKRKKNCFNQFLDKTIESDPGGG